MCGRITSIRPVDEMQRITRSRRRPTRRQRDAQSSSSTQSSTQNTPQYNLAPRQDIHILRALKNVGPTPTSNDKVSEQQSTQQSLHAIDVQKSSQSPLKPPRQRVLDSAKWGFVFPSSGGQRFFNPLHNIRSDNPRLLFGNPQRCILLADAFYEWHDPEAGGDVRSAQDLPPSEISKHFLPLISAPTILFPSNNEQTGSASTHYQTRKAIPSDAIPGKRTKQPYVVYSAVKLCSQCGYRVDPSLSPEQRSELSKTWAQCQCVSDKSIDDSESCTEVETGELSKATPDIAAKTGISSRPTTTNGKTSVYGEEDILAHDMLYIAGVYAPYHIHPDEVDTIPQTWRDGLHYDTIDAMGSIPTAGMVTIDANPQFHWLHERMPLLLTPSQALEWLDPDVSIISFFQKHLVTYLIPNTSIIKPPQDIVDYFHLFHGDIDYSSQLPNSNFEYNMLAINKEKPHILSTHTPVFTVDPQKVPLLWYPVNPSLTKYINGQLTNDSTVLLHRDKWREKAFSSGIGRFIVKMSDDGSDTKSDDSMSGTPNGKLDAGNGTSPIRPISSESPRHHRIHESSNQAPITVSSSIVGSSKYLQTPQQPQKKRPRSTPILELFQKQTKHQRVEGKDIDPNAAPMMFNLVDIDLDNDDDNTTTNDDDGDEDLTIVEVTKSFALPTPPKPTVTNNVWLDKEQSSRNAGEDQIDQEGSPTMMKPDEHNGDGSSSDDDVTFID